MQIKQLRQMLDNFKDENDVYVMMIGSNQGGESETFEETVKDFTRDEEGNLIIWTQEN